MIAGCVLFYLFISINAHYIILLTFYILLCFCMQSMHDEDNIKGVNLKIKTENKIDPQCICYRSKLYSG